MFHQARYEGRTARVRADRLRKGQTVVAIPHGRIAPSGGVWPTVSRVSYRADGEDNRPTVYLELSDHRGAVFPLDPHEHVTLAA